MLVLGDKLANSIDTGQVFEAIGYTEPSAVPARILSLVSEFAEDSHELVNPSYSYIFRGIQLVQGSRSFIEGPIVFKSRVVAQLLVRCREIAIFTLTIGDHLEKAVARLAEDGLVMKASVLDAIGSNIAEKVAEVVCEGIKRDIRGKGFCISRRFSPGYCDWDVSEQEIIFDAMSSHSVGVCLTESHLMLPRKSISGIIGIGDWDSHVDEYSPCRTCPSLDCQGRRV